MWQPGETSISLPNLSKRLAALIVSFSCCLGGIPIQKSKRFSRSSESSVTFVLTCVLVQIHKGHSMTPTQTMHFFVAFFFQTNIHLHCLNAPPTRKIEWIPPYTCHANPPHPFVRFTCISNVSWSAPGCSGSAPSCVSFPKDLLQKMVENPYESTNSSWWLTQLKMFYSPNFVYLPHFSGMKIKKGLKPPTRNDHPGIFHPILNSWVEDMNRNYTW